MCAMGGLSLVAAKLQLPPPGPGPADLTFIGAHGNRLHALDWGGEGPPVLFLHGGALTAHTWDLACLQLRAAYRCLCLDLRGHGDSDWTDSYRVEDYAQDAIAVIEAMGWQRPHLVGMSLGGVTAAYAALAARGFRPASLTLVDVAPGVAFDETERMREFIGGDTVRQGVRALVEEARRLGARGDDAALIYRYATLVRENPDGSWGWKRDSRRPPDFPHILAKLEALTERAAEFIWPCLVVRGGLSRILSDEAAAAFAASCPDGRWQVVENAGHSVQEDNPSGLAEALTDFWR
jgi:pimeloyl-ACP methyl ester carboxylesterase